MAVMMIMHKVRT
jgi:hypothetical protein